jgi:hypothetical protein
MGCEGPRPRAQGPGARASPNAAARTSSAIVARTDTRSLIVITVLMIMVAVPPSTIPPRSDTFVGSRRDSPTAPADANTGAVSSPRPRRDEWTTLQTGGRP